MTRYHPALVAIHWIMALLIPVSLVMGGFVLSNIPLDDPGKAEALQGHMIAGALIGVLLVLRFVMRRATTLPDRADGGSALMTTVARSVHIGFYVLIALMVASGLTMAYGFGLIDIVFNGSGDAISPTLREAVPYFVHKYSSFALLALILLHLGATAYHSFVLKDGLLARICGGDGKRLNGDRANLFLLG